MGEDDVILVNEEAREIMRSLESSVPETEITGAVEGTAATTGAALYIRSMAAYMDRSNRAYKYLTDSIRTECSNAIAALDDFQREDDEIMALLRRLNEELGTEDGSAGKKP